MDPKPSKKPKAKKPKRKATRPSDLAKVVAEFQLLRLKVDGLASAWCTQLAEIEAKIDALVAFQQAPVDRNEEDEEYVPNGTGRRGRTGLLD